jgi:hypothetical protein
MRHPSPPTRAIKNNPAPTTTAPVARATRSPAGARRSTVMAVPTRPERELLYRHLGTDRHQRAYGPAVDGHGFPPRSWPSASRSGGSVIGVVTFLPPLTRLGVSHHMRRAVCDEVQRRIALTLSAVTKVRIPITPPLRSEIENMPNGTQQINAALFDVAR